MENKLSYIIDHAYRTVPYYMKRYKGIVFKSSSMCDSFKNLPLLRKKDVLIEKENLLSSFFSPNDLLKERTSGSMGIPLTLYKSAHEKIVIGRIQWKYRTRNYGIFPHMSYARFHMANHISGEIQCVIIDNDGSISFSLLHLQDDDLQYYIELLSLHKTEWIFGTPMAIHKMAEYIKRNKIRPPKLRYIELSGEYCQPGAHQEIEEVFQCSVGNLYALRECYGVALTCKEGNHHPIKENVYIEVLDETGCEAAPGSGGCIFITTLNNIAMPFIRYETGDFGTLFYDKCPCGSSSPVLKLLGGRSSDFFTLSDRRIVNPSFFYLIIRKLNDIFENSIYQYQIKQIDGDNFAVYFHVPNGFSNTQGIESEFKHMVSEHEFITCVNWEFHYRHQSFNIESNGKHRVFI